MSEMTEALEAMVVAVANAIEEAAKAGSHSPEELKTLAEAAAAVRFGPQGAVYDYRNRTSYDYHSTNHQGEPRDRPGAGFAV